MANPFLWYRDKENLKIGGICRYNVSYTCVESTKQQIHFRLKNDENIPIRAVHILNGPFILYCHVVPYNYRHDAKFKPENPEENKELVFKNQLKPGQTFNVKLQLNSNSYFGKSSDGYPVYKWSIDVVSQIVISRHTKIYYDLMIGDDFEQMKSLNHGPLSNSLTALKSPISGNNKLNQLLDHMGTLTNPQLTVEKLDTKALWPDRPKDSTKPIHLVIITHGLFSNVTADMIYLKDSILQASLDNILVKGFEGNAGRTEKGIKRLGLGVSNYVTELISELLSKGHKIDRISFIGHSLGGPVQLYAIKNILLTKGVTYFEDRGIQPYNLVCMASPLLGVLSEMSLWISWFLDLGTLGKTGRDLTLLKKLPNFKNKEHNKDAFRPLLEVLPNDPLSSFLAKFVHLTLYANAINDGIVPLRTSALLYLDYEALGDVSDLKSHKPVNPEHEQAADNDHQSVHTNVSENTVGEVPSDNEYDNAVQELRKEKKSKYRDLFTFGTKKNKLSRRQRTLMRITAKGSDLADRVDSEEEDDGEEEDNDNEEDDYETLRNDEKDGASASSTSSYNVPPKASVIESAVLTFIAPKPTVKYILDPESRRPVIFHDKYYRFENLPEHKEEPSKFKIPLPRLLFHYSDWKLGKQVEIARKYHQPELNWRKVLVSLPPDAHNNIVVRRRFANGYGWGVIDHMCAEHFAEGPLKPKI